jgi:ferritin
MDKEIEQALNEQVKEELNAEHHYLAMSAYFDSRSLEGMAAWMLAQAREEHDHAMRIFTFILDRGGKVTLQGVDAPEGAYDSPLSAFQRALENERKVTGQINDLYELASGKRDHATRVMLEWFISEQVEEENTVQTIVDQLEMVGSDSAALLMLDQRLGERGSLGS